VTDIEINRTIHEIAFPDCWVVKKRGYYYRPNAAGYTDRPSEAWRIPHAEAKKHEYLRDEPVTIHPAPPLDYVNSLVAMAVVERWLPKDMRSLYLHNVLCITVWTGEYHASHVHSEEDIRWGLRRADARQLAVAFLRAFGAWRKA